MNYKRELSKLITKIENFEKLDSEVLKKIFEREGKAHRIGFTGPPGAGKSTLTDKIASLLADENKKVGIIAVDPTSPFTGGAILGDRIRMEESSKRGIFIRSLGSRGGIGGLSRRTYLSSLSMEAFGMDYIIIETVGVGQIDLEIRFVADTTVVVLTPESGDYIQAMKAGLMEIGDIYVVNKADRPGAEEIKREIEFVLSFLPYSDWNKRVLLSSGLRGDGIEELKKEIVNHQNYLESTKKKEKIVKERRKRFLKDFLRDEIWDQIDLLLEKNGLIEKFLADIELGKSLDDIKKDFYNFLKKGLDSPLI
ncbi:MAG: methylmalonyl Co-A mutase-associated GTPase MeaB [Candidatus Hydrothermales bacterium]